MAPFVISNYVKWIKTWISLNKDLDVWIDRETLVAMLLIENQYPKVTKKEVLTKHEMIKQLEAKNVKTQKEIETNLKD